MNLLKITFLAFFVLAAQAVHCRGQVNFVVEGKVNVSVIVGSDVGGAAVVKYIVYDQSSTATPTIDPGQAYQFNINVNPGTTGTLLTSSTITPPAGSTGTISPLTLSSNGLFFQQMFFTKAAMDAAFLDGTYNFVINTSTPNTYTGPINTGSDNYPTIIPQITGGTWNGGNLVVDPTKPYTLNWPSFTGYAINLTINNTGISTQLTADGTRNSYVIPANTLQPNTTYSVQLDFGNSNNNFGTIIVPGGDNIGGEEFLNRTQFTIQTVTPTDFFGGLPSGTNMSHSPWFGYYTTGSYPLIYQYNLGYEYAYNTGGGVYLYDYSSGHFWYTQGSYFPFVYDYSLNTFLYYYQANTPHRHFYDFSTNQVISE